MKQGLNMRLPISIGMSVNDIQSVEFLFRQGEKSLTFTYPSTSAEKRDAENIIDLYWTPEQTYLFNVGPVEMDTKITVKGSNYQPETDIVMLKMKRTLFEAVVEDDQG